MLEGSALRLNEGLPESKERRRGTRLEKWPFLHFPLDNFQRHCGLEHPPHTLMPPLRSDSYASELTRAREVSKASWPAFDPHTPSCSVENPLRIFRAWNKEAI